MCFEKGLVTSNVHYLKSGYRCFLFNAKKCDLKIFVNYTHKSGDGFIKICNGDEKEQNIVMKTNDNFNIYVKKGSKCKIIITFKHHVGSYKIKKEKINATQVN